MKACHSNGGDIMTIKAKLTALLEAATVLMDCPQMDEVAEFLLKNNVIVLPEGAIVLTREEIYALNEYQKKHGNGGVNNARKQ